MYNPMKMAIQKFLFGILEDRFANHQEIVERMCHYLVTEHDVRQFGALIGDIHQLGFTKAAKEYSSKLAEQGFVFKTTDDDPMDNK